MAIDKLSSSLKNRLTEIFEHLHTHPEISWEEFKTTQYLKELVKPYEECRIKTFGEKPGLVIEIGEGKPVIALRADMDALWQEVDGEFRANHSCGHDAHMTIVIGTLFHIIENGAPKKGTFRFVFQPAEEKGTGALALIDEGVADDIDYFYGMHLRPIEELRFGEFAPALSHGATRSIMGSIRGDDAHGARPHLNANAILVGTELFQHLNNLYINPMIPHSVKMTSFHAGGSSTNIIPGNATFSLDLRAQTNEAMDELVDKVKQITDMLANYHGVDIELDISANMPAAVLNEEAIQFMRDAILETVGENKLSPPIMTTGGDDFHFYTIKRPQIKATMLAIGCDLKPGLHHAHMTFNHNIIPQAVDILARAMQNTASAH